MPPRQNNRRENSFWEKLKNLVRPEVEEKRSAESAPSFPEEKIPAPEYSAGRDGEKEVEERAENIPLASAVERMAVDPNLSEESREVLADNADDIAREAGKRRIFGRSLDDVWKDVWDYGGRAGVVGLLSGIGVKTMVGIGVKMGLRAASFGNVAVGAAAGGIMGGTFEAIKHWRRESERLNAVETYRATLENFKSMDAVKKMECYLAVTEALSRARVDRASAEYRHLEQMSLDLLTAAKREKSGDKSRLERLSVLVETRNEEDRNRLTDSENESVKKELKTLVKEFGLNRNLKKIAFHTVKGAVIGAAAGALGAFGAEKLASLFSIPEAAAAPAPVRPAGAISARETIAAASVADKITPPATPLAEVREVSDIVRPMKKNIWNTVKIYLQENGVSHPSNRLINEGMMRVARANAVEIAGHHLQNPLHAGHVEEAARRFIDTKMMADTPLSGFESLNDLVAKATERPVEVVRAIASCQNMETVMPAAVSPMTPADLSTILQATTEAAPATAENNTWNLLAGLGLAGAAGLGAGGAVGYHLGRKRRAEEAAEAKIKNKPEAAPIKAEPAETKPVETAPAVSTEPATAAISGSEEAAEKMNEAIKEKIRQVEKFFGKQINVLKSFAADRIPSGGEKITDKETQKFFSKQAAELLDSFPELSAEELKKLPAETAESYKLITSIKEKIKLWNEARKEIKAKTALAKKAAKKAGVSAPPVSGGTPSSSIMAAPAPTPMPAPTPAPAPAVPVAASTPTPPVLAPAPAAAVPASPPATPEKNKTGDGLEFLEREHNALYQWIQKCEGWSALEEDVKKEIGEFFAVFVGKYKKSAEKLYSGIFSGKFEISPDWMEAGGVFSLRDAEAVSDGDRKKMLFRAGTVAKNWLDSDREGAAATLDMEIRHATKPQK